MPLHSVVGFRETPLSLLFRLYWGLGHKPVPWHLGAIPDARVLWYYQWQSERTTMVHHDIISMEPGSQSGFHSRGLLPVYERMRNTRHGQELACSSFVFRGFVSVGSVPFDMRPLHHYSSFIPDQSTAIPVMLVDSVIFPRLMRTRLPSFCTWKALKVAVPGSRT